MGVHRQIHSNVPDIGNSSSRQWSAEFHELGIGLNQVATRGTIPAHGRESSASEWLHKLRRAMVRPRRDQLAGAVQVELKEA
jgi:hypothetical protein